MRVIQAFDEPVRAIAVSPDGRFLAASAGFVIRVFDWVSGESKTPFGCPVPINQLAFSADGKWLAIAYTNGLYRLNTTGEPSPIRCGAGPFSGAIAIAPDGRTLVATWAAHRRREYLERWELPGWREVTGFDFWSPFQRLEFSPNGEFLAGVNGDTFELRISVTGGLNGRDRMRRGGDGFIAFARDSQRVVFGWETELRVMETRAGAVIKHVTSPAEAFADAVFVGSATRSRPWMAPARCGPGAGDVGSRSRYDWNAGGLTCVTATVDSLTASAGQTPAGFWCSMWTIRGPGARRAAVSASRVAPWMGESDSPIILDGNGDRLLLRCLPNSFFACRADRLPTSRRRGSTTRPGRWRRPSPSRRAARPRRRAARL